MKTLKLALLSTGVILLGNNDMNAQYNERALQVNVIQTSISERKVIKPEEFVMKAGEAGLLEIQLGQIALQNASSKEVKDFAQMIVNDHSTANAQLKRIAGKKKYKLPKTISSKNQQMVDGLVKLKGAEFDKEYMQHMVLHHTEDIILFEQASKELSDKELKSYAGNTVEVLKKHYETARKINEKTMATSSLEVNQDPYKDPEQLQLDSIQGHARQHIPEVEGF